MRELRVGMGKEVAGKTEAKRAEGGRLQGFREIERSMKGLHPPLDGIRAHFFAFTSTESFAGESALNDALAIVFFNLFRKRCQRERDLSEHTGEIDRPHRPPDAGGPVIALLEVNPSIGCCSGVWCVVCGVKAQGVMCEV